ncbi:MAG: DHHA1 domain-containing protein [Magnetococcus sp. WYHC-3]
MQILYHANCSDGLCAAWLCYQLWPKAKYIPVQYGSEPPEIEKDATLILDFSYSKQTLLKLAHTAAYLIVLDHHKSAQQELQNLEFCIFDMDKSGARLTWEYLCKTYSDMVKSQFVMHSGLWRTNKTAHTTFENPPWLVAYTEDRDLWKFKLSHSEEINCAIRSYPATFEAWDLLSLKDYLDLAAEGTAIMRYRKKLISEHIKYVADINIDGHIVRACQCTAVDISSELAGELAKDKPFGVVWTSVDDYRIYQLRSDKNGVDVSEVAKKFGGGGHARAAGFKSKEIFK